MIGTTLAHYRVVESLGAGGMGEVYLAEDTKLGRRVAIKLLPDHLATDPERMARFEREARVLASLNHPQIAAIHGLEEVDQTKFLVLELVDGETLEQRITRGPIPIDDALPIAGQIVDALEAAHEGGVIHRDLKPANVKVREDGQVKVLDFGLAKVHDPVASGSHPSLSHSPTLTQNMTAAGALLGTAAYMSPEQARARAVDKRADIWAFGCLLYEMLTGRKAFEGETVSDTMAAILKEPHDHDALPAGTPIQIARLLDRCLEKDAKLRLRDIGDARIALREAIESPKFAGTAAAGAKRSGASWWLVGALVAFAGIAGFLVGVDSGGVEPHEPPSYQRVTFGDVEVVSARFAPDGESILYTARLGPDEGGLYMARRGTPESTSLGHDDASLAAISVNGELAMIRNGTLARAPMSGGALRDVAESVRAADWAPDGSDLAVLRADGSRLVIEYPIGTPLYETASNLRGPWFAPDGRAIGAMELVGGRWTPLVIDLEDGSARHLAGSFEAVSGAAWPPGDDELWYSAGDVGTQLRASSLDDPDGLRIVARAPDAIWLEDVAPNGDVLARLASSRTYIRRMMDGASEHDASWLGNAVVVDLSDDGQTLLMAVYGEAGGEGGSAYIKRGDDPPVRIGHGLAADLSADGEWVLAVTASAPERVVMLPTGPGSARELDLAPLDNFEDVNFTPDGRAVILQGNEGEQSRQLFRYDLEEETLTALTEPGTVFEYIAQYPISPDGRWMLTRSEADGASTIVGLDGSDSPWKPELGPRELLFGWAGNDVVFVADWTRSPETEIQRLDLATGRRTPWRTIGPPPELPAGELGGRVVITPDGRHYAFTLRTTRSILYLIEGLR